MRKACIDLNETMKFASLSRGDLGGGKCLYYVQLAEDLNANISAARWQGALDMCLQKAIDLKYEVSRIRGQSLANRLPASK